MVLASGNGAYAKASWSYKMRGIPATMSTASGHLRRHASGTHWAMTSTSAAQNGFSWLR